MRWLPTCDDTHRPKLKALVHWGTATLSALIATYHLANGLRHWLTPGPPRS